MYIDSERASVAVGLTSWVAIALALLGGCGTSAAISETPSRHSARSRVEPSLLRAMPRLDADPFDATPPLAAGKHVALVFWQPWCAACKHEVPALLAAQAEHGSRLEVVGVVSGPDSAVDETRLRDTVLELAISYPTTRDRELSLTRSLDVSSTPTIVVLDSQRNVVFRGHRCPDWNVLLGSARGQ